MQLFENELFGSQPESVATMEGANTLKASLFTLIVLVKGTSRTFYLQHVVELITKKFPCKVVFISIDTEATVPFLRQNRTTRIVGKGANAISCDVLSIETSKDNMQIVPFLVIPEIVADLPAYLLIGHNPFELRPVLDQLETYVNRVVFDVDYLQNIGRFAAEILSLPNRHKYVGLNWARTKPWRESLARVFNTKEANALLSSCNRIEIRYSRRPTPSPYRSTEIQSILLQSWLASRLHWQPVSIEDNADHMTVHFRSGKSEITVILTPTDSDLLEEGAIVSIEIRGDNDVHYLLSYERDDRHIVVHASSQDRCEMPYALFVGSFQRGRALPSEIFLQAPSEHYIPMLEMLSSGIWDRNREPSA